MRLLLAWVLAALLLAAAPRPAQAACANGDLPCFCASYGGVWKDFKPPLEPLCTVSIAHQGGQRTFNVFLPRGLSSGARYPLWMHVHGVYWDSMDNITAVMGFPVQATEATPMWDTLATGHYRDHAFIVYPQALPPGGDPAKRTFWNIPFWHCSVGVCTDERIDDQGFIERVLLTSLNRLPVDKDKVFISGTSAGGMMIHNLLCRSTMIPRLVKAAVDLIGGVGANFRPQCHPAKKVPLRMIHGETDPVLGFEKGGDVDGSPFLSAKDAAQMWRELYGCGADATKENAWADSTATACDSLCAAPGQLELCKMKGIGHQLDVPYRGYPFTVAWQFFESHM